MKTYLFCVMTVFLSLAKAKQLLFENSTLLSFIEARCKNTSDEAFTFNIKTRLINFDGYFENLEDKQEIFCADTIFKLMPMMKQVTSDMKACFPNSNETYIPNFIFQGFSQFLEFVCGNRTLEIFYSDQGIDCRSALTQYMGQEIRNCSCDFMKIFNLEVLTFDDFCYGLTAAEECYGDVIRYGCPYFAAYRVLNRQFFRSVGDLCNNAAIYFITNMTLIISVFLSFHNYIRII